MNSHLQNPILESGISTEPGVLLLTFYPTVRREGHLLLIGNDEGTELAVNEDGSVASVEFETYQLLRFVNTTCEQFARSIRAFETYTEAVGNCSSEEEELKAVDELGRGIAFIDSMSLANVDNWWSCIVEQARHGVL